MHPSASFLTKGFHISLNCSVIITVQLVGILTITCHVKLLYRASGAPVLATRHICFSTSSLGALLLAGKAGCKVL